MGSGFWDPNWECKNPGIFGFRKKRRWRHKKTRITKVFAFESAFFLMDKSLHGSLKTKHTYTIIPVAFSIVALCFSSELDSEFE